MSEEDPADEEEEEPDEVEEVEPPVEPLPGKHFVNLQIYDPQLEQFTMGRWSSDIYQLYVRACANRCRDWTVLAGSAEISDVVAFDEVVHY